MAVDGADRQAAIVRRLQEAGRVDIASLSEDLDASSMTVRRDLDLLAEAGVLRRVRGGAVSLLMRGDELPFALRSLDGDGAKRRIAAAVAELIRDGEAVVVDSGTSGLAVAHALAGRRITAVPLSVQALAALSGSPATTVLVPGGTARPVEGSLVGPLTEAALATLRVDTTVLTCCGLTGDGGVTVHDLQDAAVKKAAIGIASRVILVAEGAKLGRSALAVVCAVGGIDTLVTDSSAPPAALRHVEAAGVTVIRA